MFLNGARRAAGIRRDYARSRLSAEQTAVSVVGRLEIGAERAMALLVLA
jgi:hypothetical protein